MASGDKDTVPTEQVRAPSKAPPDLSSGGRVGLDTAWDVAGRGPPGTCNH